jgi:hypothetical protein
MSTDKQTILRKSIGIFYEEIKQKGESYTLNNNSNPPNCPQVRPIETYWALLKRRVCNNGWKAKSVKELKEKIRKRSDLLHQRPART